MDARLSTTGHNVDIESNVKEHFIHEVALWEMKHSSFKNARRLRGHGNDCVIAIIRTL